MKIWISLNVLLSICNAVNMQSGLFSTYVVFDVQSLILTHPALHYKYIIHYSNSVLSTSTSMNHTPYEQITVTFAFALYFDLSGLYLIGRQKKISRARIFVFLTLQTTPCNWLAISHCLTLSHLYCYISPTLVEHSSWPRSKVFLHPLQTSFVNVY